MDATEIDTCVSKLGEFKWTGYTGKKTAGKGED